MINSIRRSFKHATLALAATALTATAQTRPDDRRPEAVCARWALAAATAGPPLKPQQTVSNSYGSAFIAGNYIIEISSHLPAAHAPQAVKIEAHASENAGGAPLVGPVMEPAAASQFEMAALYTHTARTHYKNCMANPGMRAL